MTTNTKLAAGDGRLGSGQRMSGSAAAPTFSRPRLSLRDALERALWAAELDEKARGRISKSSRSEAETPAKDTFHAIKDRECR